MSARGKRVGISCGAYSCLDGPWNGEKSPAGPLAPMLFPGRIPFCTHPANTPVPRCDQAA
jgi:hypothetical protein